MSAIEDGDFALRVLASSAGPSEQEIAREILKKVLASLNKSK